jgi:bacterial/archaeal transporter family-2 protein
MTTPPEPPALSPRHMALTVLVVALTVLSGAGVSLQSRINGTLSTGIGNGFVAALISFASGLVLISLSLIVSRRGRAGLHTVGRAIRERRIPWWHTAGGLGGGLFVLSQGLVVGLLGIALFTVASVAGQTISGMVIDAKGIGAVAPKAVTVTRIIGAALALVAILTSTLPQLHSDASVWLVVFPFAIGLVLGIQQALNGQIKTLAGSAVTATFFNFVFGTALLAVIAAIDLIMVGVPQRLPSNPIDYLGGVVGVLFIAGFALAIPIIGVLLQSMAAIAGQLLMGLLLDFVAPTNDAGVAISTVIGTALTLVAVVIASLRSRAAFAK